jgi:heat shock protein HslJ
MDDSVQDLLKLSTPEDQYSVLPGSRLEIPLLVENQGSLPDQVRISIEGIPLVWVSVEQPVLLLQQNDRRQITLTIQPPPPPNTHTGRYSLKLGLTSTLDPSRSAQVLVTLTVAGFEVKGRVGVLLDGLQYNIVPGEQMSIPVVVINQGLAVDTFRLSSEDLPDGWVTIPVPALRLEPGEVKEGVLVLKPPRDPSARAGRYPFRIVVASQEAPNQSARIDCKLTLAAFVSFETSLEAAQPDQNLPARVAIHNLSNVPATFQVSFDSPEGTLAFEPPEPEPVNIPSGETANQEYTTRLTNRLWVGGERGYPYSATVASSDGQSQTLEGSWITRGLVPLWAAIAMAGLLVLLCLIVAGALAFPGLFPGQAVTETPLPVATGTVTVPLPTATQSQTDQKPLLIERNWYLVSYNNTLSKPGVQEPFTRFNPDGTLIGYTGCKDLSASFQTSYNQLTITNVSLGRGTCPDAPLQQQEDAMVAVLRSARSYFVADTALQIAGDAGFLNYSLTRVNRPEQVQPPQAVIQAATQAETGQVVVFDGSASTGQVPIVSWRWDFGDGSGASGVVVQHVYPNPGTFAVSLTVTDQRGQAGASKQQIHILARPVPTAQPTVPPPTAPPPTQAPPTQAPPTQPVPTLPAPPTLVPPTEAPPTQAPPTPEPPTPEPKPEPPQASVSGPRQGYLGEPVVFDASASQPGSSPIVSYNWTFGNGQVSPVSPNPSISTIYDRAGDYEVTVFVVDANGLDSYASTRITINARLETSVWTLPAVNNQPLIPGTAITLQFLQGRLTGFAGCNTYEGRYTATDNGDGIYSVAIEQFSTGRLACPADIMNQENAYLAALQQVTTASIQENRLSLAYPSGALVYYLVGAR